MAGMKFEDVLLKPRKYVLDGGSVVSKWGQRLGSPGLSFAVACAFLDQLKVDEPLPPPETALALTTAYPYFLDVGFILGRDVRMALDGVAERVKKGLALPPDVAVNCCALAFWTGKEDLLETFAGTSSPAAVQCYAAGCRALAAGEVNAAEKAFHALEDVYQSDLDGNRCWSTPYLSAAVLLAMTATILRKPVVARLRKYGRMLVKSRGFDSDYLPDGGRRLSQLGSFFNRLFGNVDTLVGMELLGGCPSLEAFAELKNPRPSDALFFSWQYHVAPLRREANRAGAARAVGMAQNLLARGYGTLAATLAAESLPVCDEKTVGDFRAAVQAAGGRWLFAEGEEKPKWRLLLETLDGCLPKSVKTDAAPAKAKSGRVIWLLDFDRYWGIYGKEGVEFFTGANIYPYFRGPRGDESGADDRPVAFKQLAGPQYAECLSEADRRVVGELSAAAYDVRRNPQAPQGALEALCDQPNVLVYDSEWERSDPKSRRACVYTRGSCEVTGTTEADGSLRMAVPAWAKDVVGPYVIRVAGVRSYSFVPMSKSVRDVVTLFNAYGEKGKLCLPEEGVKAARDVLQRLAQVMPLAGRLSSIVGNDLLARLEGDTTPLVRLSYEDDGLAVFLLVKPLADDPFVSVPGAGLPERVMKRKDGMAVLVRALAEERRRAAAVRAALEPFENWQEDETHWAISDLSDVLGALDALHGLGESVRLEWPEKKRRLSVTRATASQHGLQAVAGADHWFSVKGGVTFDDGRVVDIVKLLEALRNRVGRYVTFGDGEYLALTKSLLRKLEALEAAGRCKGEAIEVAPSAVPMLAEAFAETPEELPLPEPVTLRAADIRRELGRRYTVPARLKAVLRPYQEEGFTWLSQLAACGFGACLADDMGLGKTVEVIALLLARAAKGASLVVAPASVCGNWRNELQRFAPTLTPVMAWDEARDADEASAVASAGPHDVVIVSYGMLVVRPDRFKSRTWNGVVLDEAQAIKNDATKRAHLVKELQADFRVAATGTPLENRLNELWSLFDFLNPGLLGPAGGFLSRFTDGEGRPTPQLKRLVSPFILRRLKRDVLDDLPEKTEIDIAIHLDAAEREAYEGCRRHALAQLKGEAAENRISILAELTRLRRFCCHPSLVLPDFTSSVKMEALLSLLSDLKASGHRALVFSQFTDYLAIVQREIGAQGWTHQYLDGTTPAAERERRVADFQRGEGDFFLISLKAGGMGLNLTAANYVILLDPWWNPAVESQAADRAHRIGQKNPVTVYRLLAEDTVEERVHELHAEKKALAEDVLDNAVQTKLAPADLLALMS